MIPTYSESGKLALPFLAKSSYKAFIFFEDENSENFYEEILKKITPDFRNFRVICLKGKNSLIEHSRDPENSTLKNKTIYILDKDFDDFLNKIETDSNLFYLNRYSIENFLLEQNAIEKIILEEKPKQKQNIKEILKLEEYLSNIKKVLSKLINFYLITQEFSLNIPSCKEPIQKFTKNNQPWVLCEDKINTYIEDVSALLILNNIANTEEELQDIISSRCNQLKDLTDVPGKQIIDLVRSYIGHIFDMRILSRESFCYRLATACAFESLDDLRVRIAKFT